MGEQISEHLLYYYVSSKAAFDPCKTIYVCAPGAEADDPESAGRFAVSSGWQALAEENGAVLVVPAVPHGWKEESTNLLSDIYGETKNRFHTRSGKAIWGRGGSLWCWETLLYLVGYEDGAVFAGNVLTGHPNMFAAAVLVNGAPDDYTAADQLSSHWMVPGKIAGYDKKNRDIPVHLWMFEKDRKAAEQAVRYYSGSYGKIAETEISIYGYTGHKTVSLEAPAYQTRIFYGDFDPKDLRINQIILTECFDHVIRWKNGPDGMLALIESKKEFYENPRFLRRTVTVEDKSYDYFVHLPAGKTREETRGLPLVFTVHGRGEPAWLFTAKNGWDKLADETGEFILVSPDSPGNIWFLPRDGRAFPEMIRAMAEEFQIDLDRVYLSGFSNGGMLVRELAAAYPGLFAGISPWNAPVSSTSAMMKVDSSVMVPEFDEEFKAVLDSFLAGGYEMPCAFMFGDRDMASRMEADLMIQPMLTVNACGSSPAEILKGVDFYTNEKGYIDGERFHTAVYRNKEGEAMVTVTVMKDMPHGAVHDESRAAWAFLKRFARPDGTPKVKLCE